MCCNLLYKPPSSLLHTRLPVTSRDYVLSEAAWTLKIVLTLHKIGQVCLGGPGEMSWNPKKLQWLPEDFLGQSWSQGRQGHGCVMPLECPWQKGSLAGSSRPHKERRQCHHCPPPLTKLELNEGRASRTYQVFALIWLFSSQINPGLQNNNNSQKPKKHLGPWHQKA